MAIAWCVVLLVLYSLKFRSSISTGPECCHHSTCIWTYLSIYPSHAIIIYSPFLSFRFFSNFSIEYAIFLNVRGLWAITAWDVTWHGWPVRTQTSWHTTYRVKALHHVWISIRYGILCNGILNFIHDTEMQKCKIYFICSGFLLELHCAQRNHDVEHHIYH